ncbi:RNA polymerase sigma factor [Flavimarina sp. Hel_I_48]|uniref:RNA polymerase sigma factor n=1 Tax=Flavimarina sp. Hel_I_48 TaxID=1392488 RepID=UPI0004DF99F4|nr:sigma-70 family RNA polymerase sigma factor [Flavimarina sp. Hel_I_48]
MSLDQLIKDCKKEKASAREELYRRYASMLYSVSIKYSRNREEAEDNLQDAFITVFTKIGQYTFKGSFDGWLKRIVINTALQCYRQQPVFDIVNEGQIPEVEVEIDDEQLPLPFLLKIIQDLPDRYRLVFNLYALDGFSHKEVAEMLKISENTSKSNLSRARLILKEKIEAYYAQNDIHSSTQ